MQGALLTALILLGAGWQKVEPATVRVIPSELPSYLKGAGHYTDRLASHKYIVRIELVAQKAGSESVLLVGGEPAFVVARAEGRRARRRSVTVSSYGGCGWDPKKLMHVCPSAGIAGQGPVVITSLAKKKRILVVSFIKGATTTFFFAYDSPPPSFYYLDLKDVGGSDLSNLGRHAVKAVAIEVKEIKRPTLPPPPPEDVNRSPKNESPAAGPSPSEETARPSRPSQPSAGRPSPAVESRRGPTGASEEAPAMAVRISHVAMPLRRAMAIDGLNIAPGPGVWIRLEMDTVRNVSLSFGVPPRAGYVYAWTGRRGDDVLLSTGAGTFRLKGVSWNVIPVQGRTITLSSRLPFRGVMWLNFGSRVPAIRSTSPRVRAYGWGTGTVAAFRGRTTLVRKRISWPLFRRLVRTKMKLRRVDLLDGYDSVLRIVVVPSGTGATETVTFEFKYPQGTAPGIVLGRSFPAARAKRFRSLAQIGETGMCRLGARPFCPYHFHGLGWGDLTGAFMGQDGAPASRVTLVLRPTGRKAPRRVIFLIGLNGPVPDDFLKIRTDPQGSGPSVRAVLYQLGRAYGRGTNAPDPGYMME